MVHCDTCKDEVTKVCNMCDETKPSCCFDKNRRVCKVCRKMRNQKYYEANKHKIWSSYLRKEPQAQE